jgi:D-alanyl-D-alanine carboxypeptidase
MVVVFPLALPSQAAQARQRVAARRAGFAREAGTRYHMFGRKASPAGATMVFGTKAAASSALGAALALSLAVACGPAQAAPALVVDASTGQVLHAEDAARPWRPASLTKLMTVYVALKAVRENRLTLDTPLIVSNRAARMAPSKMGFPPGSEVTLDNALKMIMVKSANDVSVTIAEGVSGSVPAFAAEMNAAARALGMTQSHFVNPHGLHDEAHVSSARDMALLARALILHFPEQAELYGIGALKLASRVIPTHNGLLGRYPGADGMKTGFVCASGFNVVASATRNGRRLIVVVMGSPNAKARTLKAMALFENGFATSIFSRGGADLARLPLSDEPPPDMRPQVCGKNRAPNADEDFAIPIAAASASADNDTPAAFFGADRNDGRAALAALASGDLGPRPAFIPVNVYLGRAPGWTGAARGPSDDEAPLSAAELAPSKKAQARAARAAKQRAAQQQQATKPATAKPAAAKQQQGAKPAAAKPAVAKPAPSKPAPAKPAAKPAQAGQQKPRTGG